MDQQKLAVNTGYWPLFRYNPDWWRRARIRSSSIPRRRRRTQGFHLQRNALHHAGEEQSRRSKKLLTWRNRCQRAMEAVRLYGARTGHRGGDEMIDLSKTIDLSTTYLG